MSLKQWQVMMARPMLVLSLIYSITFIYPIYFYPAPHLAVEFCRWINHGIWALFGIDYVIMFSLAPKKRKFVKAHIFELVLVALPFARALRPLRAILFISQAGFRSRRQLIKNIWWVVAAASVLMILIMSAAILDVERNLPNGNIHGPSDAIWWALVTVTTIGYGDKFPVSNEGRLIAGFLIVFGVIMMATITAALAAWILEQQVEEDL
jgi:voltage-gated potassium channel